MTVGVALRPLTPDLVISPVRWIHGAVFRPRNWQHKVWEERDPKLQQLIAIHRYAQTFEGHRVIWMDGRRIRPLMRRTLSAYFAMDYRHVVEAHPP